MNLVARLAEHFTSHRDRILADWFELLSFETVGADPARLGECARCTAWLRRYLKGLGFTVEVCLTEGQPVLLAERTGSAGAPTALFYGHYDVQPADPLELWESPPFEPQLRDDRVFARGAQDNKGQLFAFLEGVAALIAAKGRLPTIKLVLDGEEESGSQALRVNLPNWARRLAADVLLVCDTGMHESGRPAITAGLRGMAHLTVRVNGPKRDLHSGTHGGVAPNPALGLARLLATLHDADGKIDIAGFLDHLTPPSPGEQARLDDVPFDAAAYEQATGVPPLGGEADLPAPLRSGFRPTIEVNGLHSGYGGPGSKTIIPAAAMAKLSLRLCPGQEPQRCLDLLVTHLHRHLPPGLALDISEIHAAGAGFRLPLNAPLVRMAETVLTELDARGPVFVWEGASVPIVSDLWRITGAAPLLVGFGREADCIHAPNESFSLGQFQMALKYAGLVLAELAGNDHT